MSSTTPLAHDEPVQRPELRVVHGFAEPDPVPAVDVRRTVYNTAFKPLTDRVIAAAMLAVLAPVMLTIALAIRIQMGNPILFRQRRVGLGGEEFDVLKFRTMRPDRRRGQRPYPGTTDRRKIHKTDEDPRHTPLGRFLRKWSLDELPQLINVMRGEMSLVGPRPELVEIVARYEADEVHQRHAVMPGITGLWQISARGDGLMHHNPELDLVYVERQSFLVDTQILFRTPLAALGRGKGA